MEPVLNPLAPHVLPYFAPAGDGSDPMMFNVGVVLLLIVLGLGVLFFWVHSLPERLAHRTKKAQMELVAVLCLLALFTHVHAFWVGALLLALIDIPTLARPVERIAGSLERMAGGPADGRPAHEDAGAAPPEPPPMPAPEPLREPLLAPVAMAPDSPDPTPDPAPRRRAAKAVKHA
jgi:hypothetical protein